MPHFSTSNLDSTITAIGRKTYSVSQILGDVQRLVEDEYRVVHIVGEISSYKVWRSGHWYFDLKDDKAVLPVVMFKGSAAKVQFTVKDGLQVCISGRLSVYSGQSKVQLIAAEIEPLGRGALALAFEQLKERLSSEGLFAAERKKELPAFPLRVGLVTSPQGAALQDMLRIFRQRMPKISVLLAPVRVQGDGSALEIARGIKQLDETDKCDVIIVGRGGGSLEDLWAFNEEVVARQIAACRTPIVSAVGHETDYSIADFVADRRCATPTHAAGEVIPALVTINELLGSRLEQFSQQFRAIRSKQQLRLGHLTRRLTDPRILIVRKIQQVDALSAKLKDSVVRTLRVQGKQLAYLADRISARSPRSVVAVRRKQLAVMLARISELSPDKKLLREGAKIEAYRKNIDALILKSFERRKEKLALLCTQLDALSPLKILGRGYAAVKKAERIVSSASQLKLDDTLTVQFFDGEISARVLNIELDKEKVND